MTHGSLPANTIIIILSAQDALCRSGSGSLYKAVWLETPNIPADSSDIHSMKTAVVILVVLAILNPGNATWSWRSVRRRSRAHQLQRCFRLFYQGPAHNRHGLYSYGQHLYRSLLNLRQGLQTLGGRTQGVNYRFSAGTPDLYRHWGWSGSRSIYIEKQRRICCQLCPRLPGCSVTHTRATAATTTRPSTMQPTTTTTTPAPTTAATTTTPTTMQPTTTPTTPAPTTAATTTRPTTMPTQAQTTTTTTERTTAPTTRTTTVFTLPPRGSQ